LLTQGSHRSVRAHISAYGSSNDGFAMQQRCIPGMLSWAVSLIRNSKFDASDVFPDPGSNIRHPLSVLPSLHRVLRDQFPGFISTMRVLRLPAAHLAALRFLRLAIPRLHSLRSLPDGRVRRQGLELIIRYLHPDVAEEATGAPKFLGNLISVCTCSKPTPAGLLAPDHNGAATWPLVIRRQRLPRLGLSTLNSMAFGLAVYASQCWLPKPTQDSLPVAGQALLDGVLTRKVSMKGFKVVIYISFSSPKLSWRN